MTREEAIEQLKKAYPKCCKEVDYRLVGGFDDHSSPLGQAIDMAVKALEQEPCEDAIRRQAALDAIQKLNIPEDMCVFEIKSHIEVAIATLPPVTPQTKQEPCDGAISKKAAIDAIYARYIGGKEAVDKAPANDQYAEGIDEAVCAVEDLPPVTPKQKIGHWIYDDATYNWRCDKCGETPKTMGYVGSDKFMAEHFKFCNHCGAKMIEPQGSEG